MLLTIFLSARSNIEKSFRLLENFDETLYKEILAEEDEIDRMTDRISRYTVELLPYLRLSNHVAILNQYYKVMAEFERLGDHAVNISDQAAAITKNNTHFSAVAMSELVVLEAAVMGILDEAEQSFKRRDVDASRRIEPTAQVIAEIIAELKKNHLQRMSRGECNVYADAGFTNLMNEFRRIADICSNVGIATMVRVYPELADHEHLYFDSLHQGGDENFNETYERNYARYFSLLRNPADK